MLNYKEYAKRADLSRAKALIGYAVYSMPQADKEWKKKVLEDVEKNVNDMTRSKKGE